MQLYVSEKDIGIATKVIICLLSIIVPVLVLVIEKLNSNLSEIIDTFI